MFTFNFCKVENFDQKVEMTVPLCDRFIFFLSIFSAPLYRYIREVRLEVIPRNVTTEQREKFKILLFYGYNFRKEKED